MIDFSSIYSRQNHDAFDVYVLAGCSLPEFQKTVANLINGSTSVMGRIPGQEHDSPFIMSGKTEIIRLKESFPEDAGLDGEFLYNTIDSIISDASIAEPFRVARYGRQRTEKSFSTKPTAGIHMINQFRFGKLIYMILPLLRKLLPQPLLPCECVTEEKLSLNEPIRRYFRNTEINYTRIKPDTMW
jgi:hypothetical protein